VDIYQQIREMTTKQHMSQRAVAKALGISRNIVKNTVTETTFLGNVKRTHVKLIQQGVFTIDLLMKRDLLVVNLRFALQ
jgi:DNA-binding transcriptional regulator LsrR (DeoR family)